MFLTATGAGVGGVRLSIMSDSFFLVTGVLSSYIPSISSEDRTPDTVRYLPFEYLDLDPSLLSCP